MNFTEFQLHERLQRAIAAAGFTEPTPIQVAAIPVGLEGGDIVGTAQTGTGKTAAFVLPLLHRLLTQPCPQRRTRALIITPTRELAEQVNAVVRQLAVNTNLRSATVYGGVGMTPQDRALRGGTEVIVACPGRLLDHVNRGATNFSQVSCLVLDEADRMLDMGFMPVIRRIIGLLPRERQTMLFSATFAAELDSFVREHLRAPSRIAVDLAAPATTVTHALYPVPAHLKTSLLIGLLRQTPSESVLIFTRTKHRADRIAMQLARAGYRTGVLHANRSQNQRQRALDDFRSGEVPYMVATDIAARGIDVSSISHVINYDIPDTVDNYIHRIGRTGRMARTGDAFTLVTLEDADMVQAIERVLGERIATQFLDGFNYTQPGAGSEAMKVTSRGRTQPKPKPKPKHDASHRSPAQPPPRHRAKPSIPRTGRRG